MAITSTYNRALTVSGLAFPVSTTISSDVAIPFSLSLAVAKVGTLSTRTSNTVGTLTMSAGHGITTGQRLDLFWDGGSRVGLLVGTVATNSVPFTLGSGDNLPLLNTAITAQAPTEQALAVTGDNVTVLACGVSSGGAVTFTDSSNVLIYSKTLTSTITSYVWASIDGGTNPLTGGTVAKVFVSNASSAATGTASGIAQYN